MSRDALEQNQIPIYFVAVIAAAIGGLIATAAAQSLNALVTPTIAVLMYAMFLQIPFLDLRKSLSNKRFMSALLIANFVLIPLLVWALTRGLAEHPAVLIGALLVLLTPVYRLRGGLYSHWQRRLACDSCSNPHPLAVATCAVACVLGFHARGAIPSRYLDSAFR